MAKNTRSRKWQVTINNPSEKGYTHEKIKELINELKSLTYACWCDETGKEGTYHTHIYFVCTNAIYFNSVKTRFEGAHIEMARGTSQENRDYILKEGKYEDSDKKETNHPETFEEVGEMPVERPGARNDLADLYAMIKDGMTDADIIDDDPRYILYMDKIERVRQSLLNQQYADKWRDLHVTYIYGTAGSGKSRYVTDLYGYTAVYRVTDYDHPFDGYKGEAVIVFEEYRGQLKISDLLNYLDGYPLTLPCRYQNKQACYTEVYIISNVALEDQYKQIQVDQPETWAALLRRIHEVKLFLDFGPCDYTMEQYKEFVMTPRSLKESIDDAQRELADRMTVHFGRNKFRN